jgi:CDP-glucose 4,6-dehydratase
VVSRKSVLEDMAVDKAFNNIYEGKTVLVTGDTGFKGSWLAIWLESLGARTIGFALPPKTEKDNYVICELDKRVTHIDGDIRDYDSLLEVFLEYRPEMVFHLAAQASVLDSYDNPLYTYTTNVIGTANLFEAIRNTSTTRIAVNITSDKCYLNHEWLYPYREIDPLGGLDPYSASKGASEIITSSYTRSFFEHDDSPMVASARAGNVIGGGDWAANRLFPDCMRSLSENKPIIVRNPESIRPWQYVLEPLYGYLLLGAKLYADGSEYSGAWNFGPLLREKTTVIELVKEVIRQWGSGEYVVEKNAERKPEARLLQLDISKALNKLDWFPVLDFEKAIEFSIDGYKVSDLSGEQVFHQRIEHINKYMELRTEYERG